MAVIARLTPEIAVGTHGRWRLKKVRVRSRNRPLKGSENANQNSAVATRSVSAAILVLSVPMARLVYQRGEFSAADTDLVATALFWFAFSLPFNGLFLLLTRTFFSLQRPWVPTAISGVNLAITAIAAALLYKPFGVGGIVAATVIATAVSVFAQTVVLRRQLGRLELGRLAWTTIRVSVAAAMLAGVSYAVWDLLDGALGRGLAGQVISLSVGLALGAAVYAAAIMALRIPEAQQILRLLRRREATP